MDIQHDITLLATSAFGLESLVKYELSQIGYDAAIVAPGRIEFTGGFEAIAKANLWLRTADRVLLLMGRFAAADFDALFETTKSLPWENWLTTDAEFPVNARSQKSQLTSVPAIQRATKRAIVDRLQAAHQVTTLSETGPKSSIEIALLKDEATITIDTTGAGLHKRGYRKLVGNAPIKETLAAALVQLSFWAAERPFLDPFCGSGTIAIEAALIGRNIAPGLRREFAAEAWPQIPNTLWQAARDEATAAIKPQMGEILIGTDIDPEALSLARYHAKAAGVADDVHFQQRAFEQLLSKREYGCLITNPPYGERVGEATEVEALHRSFPEVLHRLPTWSHFIITALPGFEKLVGREADRRRKLYNGRLECTYYQFHGPKPGDSTARQGFKPSLAEDSHSSVTTRSPKNPVFGGIDAKGREQAELFAARLRKRARHLRRWPTRRDVHCFRLYDRDIAEIPLVVDRYEDHLHMTEYERPHERNPGQHAEWIDLMKKTAAKTLEVDITKVFLKKKLRQRGKTQHEKASRQRYEITVREGGLQFWVNLSDYVDTGLFLDHRETRSKVRDDAKDKKVLNLFAYTGAFSVYAADGAAKSVTTVDWSGTYLDWARRNFKLNSFEAPQFEFVQEDARSFLAGLPDKARFDLAIVDPPTFSNSKRTEHDWDVQRDHVDLLSIVLAQLNEGGRIYFSTNFRRFKMAEGEIPASTIHEISRQTVPEDFRNKRIHRCWVIDK